LNDSVSEGPIICGRRSLRFPLCWRIECGMRHAQWPENFALAKMIKRLAGNPFKSHSQQDESYVAVLRVRTGRILQGNLQRRAQKQVFSACSLEQSFIRW